MASQLDKNGINTGIAWCDYTINLWWGCVEVHKGCDNCYARTLSKRWGYDIWGADQPRRRIRSAFSDLWHFNYKAEKAGEVRRVFVGSMMDIFEKPVPVVDSNGKPLDLDTGTLRDILFQDISQGIYPNLMFLFLTKRPSNIKKYIPAEWYENPPDNVMFGTSPVNQVTADKLIPQLLSSVAQGKGKFFLSVEPQLEYIDLRFYLNHDLFKTASYNKIFWTIVGGESGPHKRPFDTYWARSIRDQCKNAGVAFFMKQIDKVQPIPEDLMIRQFPATEYLLH